jgi:hypothetical protein
LGVVGSGELTEGQVISDGVCRRGNPLTPEASADNG